MKDVLRQRRPAFNHTMVLELTQPRDQRPERERNDAAHRLVSRHRHRKEYSAMTDFILIHGAWRGSWTWTRVRRLLAAAGHQVFTPTLTGLGERSHLLSRDVGLDTHVADVANLMIWESLRDIVLVGHSYGGAVVRHVADRMPDRIRSLIYLDAFVPENGKAVFDYLPDSGEGDRKLAVAHGDGWRVPPRPASFFAVNAADAPWVDSQCTMSRCPVLRQGGRAPLVAGGACMRA